MAGTSHRGSGKNVNRCGVAVTLAIWSLAGMGIACQRASHRPPSFSVRAHGDYRQWAEANGLGSSADETDGEDASIPEDATLRDYLIYAALHNPGLEAAYQQWQAELQRIAQARSLPDPRLTYRYYIREVETRVGPMRQGVGLSQQFPWFGVLEARGDAAAAKAEATRMRFEARKWRLFYDVARAYYEYFYLARSLELVRQNIRLLEHMEQVARIRYKVAAADHPDVIRAQLELGKLEDRLASLEDMRTAIVAELNAALNRPASGALPRPADVETTPADFDDARLLAWMEQSNPQLEELRREVQRREQEVVLARKAYFPSVTLGTDYTQIGDPVGANEPNDAGQDAVAVTASINLPIWWQKLSAGVQEARLRKYRAQLDVSQRRNELSARLKRALYEFRDAERKIELYRETLIPKAKQSLEGLDAAYRGGTASFIDLLDAERVLLEFELQAARALADRQQNLAELEMLVGRALGDRDVEAAPSPAPDSASDRSEMNEPGDRPAAQPPPNRSEDTP